MNKLSKQQEKQRDFLNEQNNNIWDFFFVYIKHITPFIPICEKWKHGKSC